MHHMEDNKMSIKINRTNTPSMGPQVKTSIRTKILLIFSVFSLLSLVLVSSVIGIFFGVANNTTTTESENALTNQIQTNLVTSAEENAHTINEKLLSAINDVKALADFAENLFDNPTLYGDHPSYNDTDFNAPGLETYREPEYNNEWISFDYSMYHLAPGVYDPSIGYINASETIWNYINVSANLDFMFKYTKEANPDFGWIYMGFEVGLFRSYPWSNFNPSYDPRERGWYEFEGLNADGVYITAPYMDANGLGPMITISKPVYDKYANPIGVIGADLTIDTIQATILNITILKSGYAFMINKDKLTIAHENLPDFDDNEDIVAPIDTIEPIPDSILNQIVSGGSGNSTFVKSVDGEEKPFYLAYSPIGETDFIVVTLVPEEEALASVGILRDQIQAVRQRNTIVLVVVVLIAAAISVGLGTLIAGQITRPVQALTEAVKKLTTQDAISNIVQSDANILVDPALESQDDEIGDLTRAFKRMLVNIKEERQKQD